MTRTTLALLATVLWASAIAQEDEVVSSKSLVEVLGGEQVTRAIVVRRKPDPVGMSIDLKIEFEFDSSRLTQQATGQLDQLVEALINPRLETFRFSIIGHTDAKGNESYNQTLSLSRAESVARYLTDHGVASERLDAQGKGESELLFPHKPEDPGNRRVEIINRGAVAQ